MSEEPQTGFTEEEKTKLRSKCTLRYGCTNFPTAVLNVFRFLDIPLNCETVEENGLWTAVWAVRGLVLGHATSRWRKEAKEKAIKAMYANLCDILGLDEPEY